MQQAPPDHLPRSAGMHVPTTKQSTTQKRKSTKKKTKRNEKRKAKKVNSGVGLLIHLIETGAGKKTQKEIEEEKNKIDAGKKNKERKLEEKKSKIAKKFQAERVAEFLDSLTSDEKDALTTKVLKAYKGNHFDTELIKGTGLNTPIARIEIQKYIPNYEEEKEAYINSKM